MSRVNDVAEFIEHMVNMVTSRDLSREARILVESKLELKRRTRVHKACEKKVKERDRKARLKAQRALELRAKEDVAFCDPIWKLELEEHNPEVLAKRRKPWLELQLLWHRRLATEAKERLPSKSTLKNNMLRAEQLSRCILKANLAVSSSSASTTEPPDGPQPMKGIESAHEAITSPSSPGDSSSDWETEEEGEVASDDESEMDWDPDKEMDEELDNY
jgi:hypothetical protein